MKISLQTIKAAFKTGKKPTQQEFWNVFDSFWHKNEITPEQVAAIDANSSKRSYPAVDEQKLAGIEEGATVGATAEQAAAIEGNTSKRSYPAADEQKLAEIEEGATVGATTEQATAIESNTEALNNAVEVFGTIPQETIDVLLDEGNWLPSNNELFYTAQTLQELGLYPGLEIWNISAAYFYTCTNNAVFRVKRVAKTVEVLELPNNPSNTGGDYTLVLPKGVDKFILKQKPLSSSEGRYDNIFLQVPELSYIVNRNIDVMTEQIDYGTTLRFVDQNGARLLSDTPMYSNEVFKIVASSSEIIDIQIWRMPL